MKVTVEFDDKTANAVAPTPTALPASAGESGGESPDAAAETGNITAATRAGNDAGVPPAWLVEAIEAASAASPTAPQSAGAAVNGYAE